MKCPKCGAKIKFTELFTPIDQKLFQNIFLQGLTPEETAITMGKPFSTITKYYTDFLSRFPELSAMESHVNWHTIYHRKDIGEDEYTEKW